MLDLQPLSIILPPHVILHYRFMNKFNAHLLANTKRRNYEGMTIIGQPECPRESREVRLTFVEISDD